MLKLILIFRLNSGQIRIEAYSSNLEHFLEVAKVSKKRVVS